MICNCWCFYCQRNSFKTLLLENKLTLSYRPIAIHTWSSHSHICCNLLQNVMVITWYINGLRSSTNFLMHYKVNHKYLDLFNVMHWYVFCFVLSCRTMLLLIKKFPFICDTTDQVQLNFKLISPQPHSLSYWIVYFMIIVAVCVLAPKQTGNYCNDK